MIFILIGMKASARWSFDGAVGIDGTMSLGNVLLSVRTR